MDGSHVTPEDAWLIAVQRLGEAIRLRCYDEPHASQAAELLRHVVAGSCCVSPAHRFEYLKLLHNEVLHGGVSAAHGPSIELLLINELLAEYPHNDEYSRFLIGRKQVILQGFPWLGSPGEAGELARALKRLTPPSRTRRTAFVLLDLSVRYYLHRQARRSLRK